jgi:hypothetical protein
MGTIFVVFDIDGDDVASGFASRDVELANGAVS